MRRMLTGSLVQLCDRNTRVFRNGRENRVHHRSCNAGSKSVEQNKEQIQEFPPSSPIQRVVWMG